MASQNENEEEVTKLKNRVSSLEAKIEEMERTMNPHDHQNRNDQEMNPSQKIQKLQNMNISHQEKIRNI